MGKITHQCDIIFLFAVPSQAEVWACGSCRLCLPFGPLTCPRITGEDNSLIVLDALTGTVKATLNVLKKRVKGMALKQDASGAPSRQPDSHLPLTLRPHTHAHAHAHIHAHTSGVYVACEDGTLSLLDAKLSTLPKVLLQYADCCVAETKLGMVQAHETKCNGVCLFKDLVYTWGEPRVALGWRRVASGGAGGGGGGYVVTMLLNWL